MTPATITVEVPITFKQRGGHKLIVAPDGTTLSAIMPRAKIDNVLVKALARAFRWQKLLDEGIYTTIKEIAATEKLDKSYVGDVLRLTLLAPDIVEMILDGKQPATLQLEQIRKSVPIEWERQRASLVHQRTTNSGLDWIDDTSA